MSTKQKELAEVGKKLDELQTTWIQTLREIEPHVEKMKEMAIEIEKLLDRLMKMGWINDDLAMLILDVQNTIEDEKDKIH